MTNSYYECHLTIEPGERDLEYDIVTSGWKFSSIDGDPVDGRGVRSYATRHYKSSLPVEVPMERMHLLANQLEAIGHRVTRRKVEQVVYDTRSAKVRPCDGGCPECHLDDVPCRSRDSELSDLYQKMAIVAVAALAIGLVLGRWAS